MSPVAFDSGAIAGLAGVFATAGEQIQEALPSLKMQSEQVESAEVIGAAKLVPQYTSAANQWMTNLVQLASSLACMADKLNVAASAYDKANDASTMQTR